MLRLRLSSIVPILLALACSATPGTSGRVDGAVPGIDAGTPTENCVATEDADGDGIADAMEGTGDFDGDGTPNYLDLDSDGDGVPDADEAASDPCFVRDSDGDDAFDWLDVDSDNDGLNDGAEVNTYHTDPRNTDSDGDGVTDLGEVEGTMTDPNNSASTIDPNDFFVLLPYGESAVRTLTFSTDIDVADVYLLIDTTGSMQSSIDNVRNSLANIVSEVGTRIDNVQIGLGSYRDFPFGSGWSGYGASGDYPYENLQNITADISAVQTALAPLGIGNGADVEESLTEALFRTATGVGQTWTYSGGGSYTLGVPHCPAVADDFTARIGFPCFREGALPIIVAVTDAPTHQGPDGYASYNGISPSATTYDTAAAALNSIGARVIGVSVGTGGASHLESYARATGTVDGSGQALVYQAAGGTVSNAVVDGIASLVEGVPQDVTSRTRNVAGNPDDVDATQFIKAITPVATVPADAASSMDATTFYDVPPSTRVEFSVDFENDFRAPSGTTEIFRALIVVVGNGVAELDTRQVFIVVPPNGTTILI